MRTKRYGLVVLLFAYQPNHFLSRHICYQLGKEPLMLALNENLVGNTEANE